MKPVIGLPVQYLRPNSEFPEDPQRIQAAVITAVHDDGTVNLSVFTDDGNNIGRIARRTAVRPENWRVLQ